MRKNIAQQLLDDSVQLLATELGLPIAVAFVRAAFARVTARDFRDFDDGDFVDASGDKGIDILSIDDRADVADVYIMQGKKRAGFSANAMVSLSNGVTWVLDESLADVDQLENLKLRDRIREFRSVRQQVGPSRMNITVCYACAGETSALSREYKQEKRKLLSKCSNAGYRSFQVLDLGASEMEMLTERNRRQQRAVDADLPIIYDKNIPSIIEYGVGDLKGVICTVRAADIAALVNKDPIAAIYDDNLRRFLGLKNTVNDNILKTCTDSNVSHEFWFLNNGITISCRSLEPVKDSDNPFVRITGLQIINGCQTSSVLGLAAAEERLQDDTRVLVRVYELGRTGLDERIVCTTNTQNRIDSRDLHANDEIQVLMEKGFLKYDVLYERKNGQYRSELDKSRIVTNEAVGQAYLSLALFQPSDARRRKYKVWGELYDTIFCGRPVERYMLSYLICKETQAWLKQSGYGTVPDDVRRKLANNAAFHLALTASGLWRGTIQWDADGLDSEIAALRAQPTVLSQHIEAAFRMLHALATRLEFASDIDVALKSAPFDRAILSALDKKGIK